MVINEAYQPTTQISEVTSAALLYSWDLSDVKPDSRIRIGFENSTQYTTLHFNHATNELTVIVQPTGEIIPLIEGKGENGNGGSSNSSFVPEFAKTSWSSIEAKTSEKIHLDQKFPLLTFHYGHTQGEDC